MGFGPDIFPQIVVTIHTFIPRFPTPLPPAFDKATTLQCTLVSTDFKVFLHSYSLLETPLDEHCGVHCLAGILKFIDRGDYCPLWKDQPNDSAQCEHPFDFCKAALINIATHSHPGAPIPPTPQPRLHLRLISGMGRANAVKPILPPYSPIPPMGSLYPYPFGHTCCGQSYCQGLAGPWYARREREAVKARIQWFNGSEVQMRARAQTRQRLRGSNEIASER